MLQRYHCVYPLILEDSRALVSCGDGDRMDCALNVSSEDRDIIITRERHPWDLAPSGWTLMV